MHPVHYPPPYCLKITVHVFGFSLHFLHFFRKKMIKFVILLIYPAVIQFFRKLSMHAFWWDYKHQAQLYAKFQQNDDFWYFAVETKMIQRCSTFGSPSLSIIAQKRCYDFFGRKSKKNLISPWHALFKTSRPSLYKFDIFEQHQLRQLQDHFLLQDPLKCLFCASYPPSFDDNQKQSTPYFYHVSTNNLAFSWIILRVEEFFGQMNYFLRKKPWYPTRFAPSKFSVRPFLSDSPRQLTLDSET